MKLKKRKNNKKNKKEKMLCCGVGSGPFTDID